MPKNLTKYLIYLAILLVPAYLIRFTIFGIPTNILEILVLMTFISTVLSKQKFDYKEFYKQNKVYFFGILLTIAGLFISAAANENYRASFGIIKGWFIIPLIFSWVLFKEVKSKEGAENIIKWLYLSIFWVSVVSFAYYFQNDLTYDGRLKTFYLSPNHLAMFLAPGIFIGIYLAQAQSLKLKAQNYNAKLKTFYFISLLMISLSLYLTYSYAAWLAVVISFVIGSAILYRDKINKNLLAISLLVIFLLVMSQWNTTKFNSLKSFSRSSLESRMIIWKSAGKILSDNPIWGIGPGNFQNKYLKYQKYFPPYLEWAVPQPHNLYLAFWLNAGISGLAGFLILIFNWLKNLSNFIKKQKSGTIQIAAAMLGIMLYILIHGLADTPYWKNDLALVFWITFSLGIIIQKLNIDSV